MNDAAISAAIKEIEAYSDDLPKKADRIQRRVAKELRKLCKVGFNGAQGEVLLDGELPVPDVQVGIEQDGKVTVVIAYGTEAYFIEFGAGVYYNGPVGSTPRPNTPPDIKRIGTYGKGYGAREVWGYYEGGKTDNPEENKKRLRLTHGTSASMPMYFAAQEVAKMVPEIAREVFKGG